MKNRDSFVFYKSISEAINKIKNIKLKLQAYDAIVCYGLCGEEPTSKADAIIQIVFAQAKPVMDKAFNRYNACVENGKKGGRPKKNESQNLSNKKPKENQTKTKEKANPNLNDNDNVNDININNINIKREIEKEQQFLTSLKNEYPNLVINVNHIDFTKYDTDKILLAIKQSPDWLQKSSLKFILDKYDKVIAGDYVTFNKIKDNANFTQRNYTKQQLNDCWDNLDNIEV